MSQLLISGSTHTGMHRKENEDAFICRPIWERGAVLLAVIDGVGGYAGGARAAMLARESIEQYMEKPSGDVQTMLKEAVVFANNRIFEERALSPAFSDMCCVLTVVVADPAQQLLYYAHVGDARLYKYASNRLKKITRDHSLVGMQEDAGEISEERAMQHPQRHMILREVGSALHRVDDPGFLEAGVESFHAGDQLLLCSDGLSDMLGSFELSAVLQQPSAPGPKVEKLIRMANEAGGHDNITVVLAKFPVIQGLSRKTQSTKPVQQQEKPAAPAPKPRRKSSRQQVFYVLVPVLVLLVASGWMYFAGSKNKGQVENSATANPFRDTVAALPPAGNDAVVRTDTVYLRHSLDWTGWKKLRDSLPGEILLVPASDSKGHFAAIDLNRSEGTPADTLELKDLRFRGIDTGVHTRLNIYLRLNNTAFDSVRYPVTLSIKK